VRDAETALREAESKVSKLEEALKEESDKVKRLEGLIASAPVGPSGEFESEFSDGMRKLLAEKVAMQVGGWDSGALSLLTSSRVWDRIHISVGSLMALGLRGLGKSALSWFKGLGVLVSRLSHASRGKRGEISRDALAE
jgi:hypothetical protein